MRYPRNPFFPPNAFRFGGGGGGGGTGSAGGGGPVPATPPPAPTPTPPITPANQAVIDIQQATRRQALRRHTVSSTVYAGATGGWFPQGGTMGAMSAGQTGAAPSLGGGNGKTGGG